MASSALSAGYAARADQGLRHTCVLLVRLAGGGYDEVARVREVHLQDPYTALRAGVVYASERFGDVLSRRRQVSGLAGANGAARRLQLPVAAGAPIRIRSTCIGDSLEACMATLALTGARLLDGINP